MKQWLLKLASPNTAKETVETSKPNHQLPNEIIDVILNYVKGNGQLKSLASIARANHNMYDISIPKLYETITIKEDKENQKQLAYGHSNWFTSRESRIDAFMMTTDLSHWSFQP